MKQIIFATAIALAAFTSCSNSATNVRPSEAITARLKPAIYLSSSQKYEASSSGMVKIMQMKPEYRVGDVVEIDDVRYIVEDIVGGHCSYEGAECPNAQAVMQDYQLQFHMDTVWVYDGARLVGSHIDPVNGIHGAFIDSLILADNL